MKKMSTLGTRATAAITLYAFTLTTLSPSLAWAATAREEARPAAAAATRFVDEVSPRDLDPKVEAPEKAVEKARDTEERREAEAP
jgi:hypothetical protein